MYPNATHILQPLDVSVFGPLKQRWKSICRKWRFDHNCEEITKFNICKALKEIIFEASVPNAIKSGFRACGIYPFNEDNVDYTKCIANVQADTIASNISVRHLSYLEYFESKIEPELLQVILFKDTRNKGIDWQGDLLASKLFDVWMKFQEDSEKQHPNFSISQNLLASKKDPIAVESISHDAPSTSRDFPSTSSDVPSVNSDVPSTSHTDQALFSNVANSQDLSSGISSARKSLSPVIQRVCFWPGDKHTTKAKFKRNCKRPLPSVITSDLGKSFLEEKEKEKSDKEHAKLAKKAKKSAKKPKKNTLDEDWTCNICKSSWFDEDDAGIVSKWVECDLCKKQFHFNCVPIIHLNKFQLDIPDSDDDEYSFMCMDCTELNDDSDKFSDELD